jgi:hypothetical protein
MLGDLNALGVEPGVHRLTNEKADPRPYVKQLSGFADALQETDLLPLKPAQYPEVCRIGVIQFRVVVGELF